ncbi:Hypothetical predicted protein, partial [Pelobates cultripes]
YILGTPNYGQWGYGGPVPSDSIPLRRKVPVVVTECSALPSELISGRKTSMKRDPSGARNSQPQPAPMGATRAADAVTGRPAIRGTGEAGRNRSAVG